MCVCVERNSNYYLRFCFPFFLFMQFMYKGGGEGEYFCVAVFNLYHTVRLLLLLLRINSHKYNTKSKQQQQRWKISTNCEANFSQSHVIVGVAVGVAAPCIQGVSPVVDGSIRFIFD